MSKQITVVISTWCVPFDQTVKGIRHFMSEATALAFINKASRKWWDENDGDRCIKECPETEPYEPITELGYNNARYELWGVEQGFHAMLDSATYARLNEAHYKREFTDKGRQLPGYLLGAKISGHWPQ